MDDLLKVKTNLRSHGGDYSGSHYLFLLMINAYNLSKILRYNDNTLEKLSDFYLRSMKGIETRYGYVSDSHDYFYE